MIAFVIQKKDFTKNIVKRFGKFKPDSNVWLDIFKKGVIYIVRNWKVYYWNTSHKVLDLVFS